MKILNTRIKEVERFDETRYYAQMLIERKMLFWTSKKWHNIARCEVGIFCNRRLDDGFHFKHEAEDAIKSETEKFNFKETEKYIYDIETNPNN